MSSPTRSVQDAGKSIVHYGPGDNVTLLGISSGNLADWLAD